MKTAQDPFGGPRVALAFAVFLGALILGILLRDWLSETFLWAILYVVWASELAFKSFDQRNIWVLGLMLALFLSINYARRGTEDATPPARTAMQHFGPPRGRIQFWKNQIWGISKTQVGHSYLHQHLPQLVLKIISTREKGSPEDILERIRTGAVPVPPEVYTILGLADNQTRATQSLNFSHRIRHSLDWIKNRFFGTTHLQDPRLEKVADYLESLLEDEFEF